MPDYSRRQFLGTGSAALVGAGLAAAPAVHTRASDGVAPNERLQFGLIGCNGMGWSNLEAHQKLDGVDCIGLCDVDQNVLDRRASQFEEMTGEQPTIYRDYRQMLDNDDVDFVIIGTPDHWHCLPMVEACEAGKDVYVEKPLANSIGECYVMMDAAERNRTVVQVGQWQRSAPHWQNAVDYLQSGVLGKIRHTKAWSYVNWKGRLPVEPDQEPPAGVDYDFWLGPAPDRPFNPNRFHFTFRWYWDYAGGLMTDWGVHLIDYIFYGMDVGQPTSVMSTGGKYGFPEDARETPDTQQALYTFDDFSMTWEHAIGLGKGPYGRSHGVAFVGNKGTLVIDRGGWEVIPEVSDGEYMVEAIPPRSGSGGLDAHAENFIASIKGDATPNCPVDIAANTAINAHLGNIAYKLGRRVDWDADARQFIDDKEANDHIWPTYRDPWTLPRA
jgi:predicted dehydrogenase